MLKPEEIMVPEFSKGFKGYNPREVDSFINQLINEYRELYFKNAETEEKLQAVVEKYKETSAKASEAMNNVKKMSEAIISDANKEADRIISEAQSKVGEVSSAMKQSCSEMLASYTEAFEEEKNKFLALEEKSKQFRETLLEAYKSHVADIQKNFPAFSSEDISGVNFGAEVSATFKEKMSGSSEQ